MSVLAGAAALVAVVALAVVHAPRPRRPQPAKESWSVLRTRPTTLALVLLALAMASPALTMAIILGLAGVDRRRQQRARRALVRDVADAMPDAVDLLALCTSAGQSLALAHPLVAGAVPGPLGAALRLAHLEAVAGRPRAEALHDALAHLGGRAPTLAHALVDHLRYGTPLAPTLERLGTELRLDRRRRAEEDARRVPVRLLAPLLVCVLPAFALLTVVPLLAASLRSLSL